jgi:hypothetical protein
VRGNGLFAASYTAVAELDPPVADALLEVLREAGVAAYVEPSQGRRGAYLNVAMDGAPRDRLYVDRECHDQAVRILSERLPALRGQLSAERPDTDLAPSAAEDEAWAALVARFDEQPASAVPSWPVIEDVDFTPSAAAADDTPPGEPDAPPSAPAASAQSEPDDHFVPPPPPPLPRLDPVSRVAWTALLGGPSLLVLFVLSGRLLPPFVVAFAIVAFVTGFVTLVVRMKDRPDDGTDGGAVL